MSTSERPRKPRVGVASASRATTGRIGSDAGNERAHVGRGAVERIGLAPVPRQVVPRPVAPGEPAHRTPSSIRRIAQRMRIAADELKDEVRLAREHVVQSERPIRSRCARMPTASAGDLRRPAAPDAPERSRPRPVLEGARQLVVPARDVRDLVAGLVHQSRGATEVVAHDLDRGDGLSAPPSHRRRPASGSTRRAPCRCR